MTASIDHRIVDLESRLTFMQVTVDELNLIVTRQQDQIAELTAKLRALAEQARLGAVEKDGDSKPPHY